MLIVASYHVAARQSCGGGGGVWHVGRRSVLPSLGWAGLGWARCDFANHRQRGNCCIYHRKLSAKINNDGASVYSKPLSIHNRYLGMSVKYATESVYFANVTLKVIAI